MKAVTLKIEDSVSEKFLWLLNHFSQNEIEILEKTEYISDDEYLRSVSGMKESIIKASNTPTKDFVTIDKLEW